MGLDRDIANLSRIDLFEEFGADQLRLLAFGAETVRLPAGRVLYREGDDADSGFVLVSGTIAHQVSRGHDSERPAGRSTAPALLGDIALVTQTIRPSTAIAETPCELLRLNRAQFRRILDEWPDLAGPVRDRIAESLAAMVSALGKVGERLKG